MLNIYKIKFTFAETIESKIKIESEASPQKNLILNLVFAFLAKL